MGLKIDIVPMDTDTAGEVCRWTYGGDYAMYDLDGSENCRKELLSGSYRILQAQDGSVAGFCCFGRSAQISDGHLFDVYSTPGLLDIGLGLRPNLCGRGYGQEALQCIIDYAYSEFHPTGLRLSVAAFNQRAIKVYQRAGFSSIAEFPQTQTGRQFVVMTQIPDALEDPATYRFYQPSDHPDLLAMVLDLYREDSTGEPMDEGKVRRTIAEFNRHRDKGRVVIFSQGGAIVGYAMVVFYWSNEHGGDIIYVDELYVKPHARRQGIASTLFRFLANTYQGRAAALCVEVTPKNTQALAFYRKRQFQLAKNTRLFRPLT